ncbi:MAG: 2-C-methyl-D-erythritol 4-phosphate cytidylyltransferase [Marinilabiliaceae bacterium]|nr:2-C-methyl-D-erythritol 4-phosphate cytidylyltransferase [Marinilabiliaceae bacterium]
MKLARNVIITGGGTGKRMGHILPKQFHPLNEKPILMHTIQKFYDFDQYIEIVVALPWKHIDFWKEQCKIHNFTVPHTIVEGGRTRFHSVKNGLAMLKTSGLTGIHDAVRPFVSIKTITNCYETAGREDCAVPVVVMQDSLRFLSSERSFCCKREKYRLVQTPQVFKTKIIKDAYDQEFTEDFTDDSSIVEATGQQITIVSGNFENIKITTPLDLIIAEAILNNELQQRTL